ncbi:MAG TPA: metal ABC transporter permease [Dongiaceae bacterium]
MLGDFFTRALIGGIGIALFAGPLGCFILWRRMAYFGDALSHSALLGIALGFLLGIDLTLGILGICVAVALFLLALQRQKRLTVDTLLVILSHSALSIGLVAASFAPSLRIDLTGYLFGDILAIAPRDLIWIYAGGILVLGVLLAIWQALLSLTVNEELARAEGVNAEATGLIFMLLIAVTVALAMKAVGILLVSALLIIPAAAARRFVTTPEHMAVLAAAIGAASVVAGLLSSLHLDTPAGPSIVVAAAAFFMLSLAGGLAYGHSTPRR